MTGRHSDWIYPPRGKVIASCGHQVFGDDCGELIGHHTYDTFSDGSYGPCESWGCYCPPCALLMKTSGVRLAELDAA